MKTITLIALFTLFFATATYSQTQLPIEYRVEKQSMSTPMSLLEDMIFSSYYHTKPLNIKFDGETLKMNYDNGVAFINKSVTEINRETEFEDDKLMLETILYTDNANTADTISLVVDYYFDYIQIVLPTKNSKGDYYGYTSYKKYVDKDELALN